MKILFIAASPINKAILRLDKELEIIKSAIERAQLSDQISVASQQATTIASLQRAMLDTLPTIVHFSGHGEGDKGIMLETDEGKAHALPSKALADLFALFPQLECVVLNACYSEVQAQLIQKTVPYVIGMTRAIADKPAITFSRAFYDGLGAGQTIEFAFKLARNAVHSLNIQHPDRDDEHLTPVLLKPKQVRTPSVYNQTTEQKTVVNDARREGLLRRKVTLTELLNRMEEKLDLEEGVESQMRLERSILEAREKLLKIDSELSHP